MASWKEIKVSVRASPSGCNLSCMMLSTCTPNKIEDERLVIAGVLEKAEVTKEAFEAFKTVFSEGAESAPAEISAE